MGSGTPNCGFDLKLTFEKEPFQGVRSLLKAIAKNDEICFQTQNGSRVKTERGMQRNVKHC